MNNLHRYTTRSRRISARAPCRTVLRFLQPSACVAHRIDHLRCANFPASALREYASIIVIYDAVRLVRQLSSFHSTRGCGFVEVLGGSCSRARILCAAIAMRAGHMPGPRSLRHFG